MIQNVEYLRMAIVEEACPLKITLQAKLQLSSSKSTALEHEATNMLFPETHKSANLRVS